MSNKIYINNNWRFTPKFSDEFASGKCDYTTFESVRLPHTCKEVPLHYFDEHEYQMVSGYQTTIFGDEAWKDKAILLTVDGAAHDSKLFLNGELLAEHHCGYTAFTVDLSDKIRIGESNNLVVRVDSNENLNIPPFGFVVDYMTYGGIYRDVYLEIKEQTYITDAFIRSTINNIHGDTCDATLRINSAINTKPSDMTITVMLGDSAIYEAPADQNQNIEIAVTDVKLWDTVNPNLYDIRILLKNNADNSLVDGKLIRYGFRKAEFKTDGFYLNDKKFKIRGLNRHQSYPYVGYAMPKSMQEYDAHILKNELNLNAVRTSHYPQSHYFIDKCDELGLLVFTELPGWQHIGDEAWKNQAVENVRDMILQYRNHTSIILWGVRINESVDDDEFYLKTNQVAHELDDSRPTGGVRCYKKSNLLEDVYTYNDFVHDGKRPGCEPKKKVTSDMNKAYLISEYNGHMYPTKAFDTEEHRTEHALRHARVLNDVAGEDNISGSFGWCMFDYNTHKDFGSGDRICYHGVMDMFRNPKMAAYVYACQGEDQPVLEFSSSMDIGEHPGCNRGDAYIFTNADSVKMYKNGIFLKEYKASDSKFQNLAHGPIAIDDYVGDAIAKDGKYNAKTERLIKDILNEAAKVGLYGLSTKIWIKAGRLMLFHGLKMTDAVELYNKYVGDWGGATTTYKLEAIKDGKTIKTLDIAPMQKAKLNVNVSHTNLTEGDTYDVAAVRFIACDENNNQLFYFNDPVKLSVEGPLEIIGPDIISLNGGMGGTYVKTTGGAGLGRLIISNPQLGKQVVDFTIN